MAGKGCVGAVVYTNLSLCLLTGEKTNRNNPVSKIFMKKRKTSILNLNQILNAENAELRQMDSLRG